MNHAMADRPDRTCLRIGASALTAIPALPAFADPADASLLSSFLSTIVALAIVLALAYFGLRLLRKARQRGWVASGPMTLRATLPIGMREKIVMVEVGGRLLVLGVTSQQISLLRDSPAFSLDPKANEDGTRETRGRDV